MTSPESRNHATSRIEHPTPEEIEEIDFKRNYMKMIEELKQEVKICHKEMEINKKLDEINKSLKDSKEKQEIKAKAIKRVKKTVQDLENEIKVMKKT